MNETDLLRVTQLRRDLADGTALRLRQELRLPRTEAAAAAGIAAGTLAQWEAGKRIPRGAPATRYAEVLDHLSRCGGDLSLPPRDGALPKPSPPVSERRNTSAVGPASGRITEAARNGDRERERQ